VQLEKNEQRAQLAIWDNGQGFELPEDWLDLARGGHLGLLGMRERAEAIGGRLEIRSVVGNGTTVRVVAPLEKTGPG